MALLCRPEGGKLGYNDSDSYSGYNVTRYRLFQMGETHGFFGGIMQARWHQPAISMVFRGDVAASAIDSQVLAVELRDHPELLPQLKIIDSLGPASIQPAVIANNAPANFKHAVRAKLPAMADREEGRLGLPHGFVKRFVAVTDAERCRGRTLYGAALAGHWRTVSPVWSQ